MIRDFSISEGDTLALDLSLWINEVDGVWRHPQDVVNLFGAWGETGIELRFADFSSDVLVLEGVWDWFGLGEHIVTFF
ncbi:MAG: hypothetical protein R3D81_04750 [Thalassovita sp.]